MGSNHVTESYRMKAALLKKYMKSHKSLPPKSFVVDGVSLGSWCCNQRYLYRAGKLNPAQIRLLKSTPIFKTGEYHLWARVDMINRFYESYGRFPFRDEVAQGFHIGIWWNTLCNRIWKNDFSEVDREYIKTHAPALWKQGRERDLLHYWFWIDLLKTFQRETGETCPKTRTVYKGKTLGNWCARQKTKYKQGKLTKNQEEILLKMGLIQSDSLKK